MHGTDKKGKKCMTDYAEIKDLHKNQRGYAIEATLKREACS